jgi:sulfatase modifying factor 1
MPSLVGAWPGGQRVDCSAPAQPGEVCVPGGAFWMGNPAVSHVGLQDGDRLRLVVLSPFYIDATEATVAAYRTSGLKVGAEWSGTKGCSASDYCTYTRDPGTNEALPISCITEQNGLDYCHMLGKDLPTEAQYEYVAGGLASHAFVWGRDPPGCADAVIARSGAGFYAGYAGDCILSPPADTTCSGAAAGGLTVGGPQAPGAGGRDQITVTLPSGKGTVYDLDGNMREETRDSWNLLTDPCWSQPGIYADPVCTAAASSSSIRGGAWTTTGAEARAATRNSLPVNDYSADLGVRCVRSGR